MKTDAELMEPRFATCLIEGAEIGDAAARLAGAALERLQGSASFGLLFASVPQIFRRRAEVAKLVQELGERLGTAAIIGCSGSGVVGGGREVERRPALTLFAGRVPGASATVFHLSELQRRKWEADGLLGSELDLNERPGSPLFLLSDPFTFDIEGFLAQLEARYPGLHALGGLASGAGGPGLNVLIASDEIVNNGCVGLQLAGRFGFETLVSQGCKPIGRPLVITKGKGNRISGLRGRAAAEILRETIDELPADELELARTSLLIGRVIDEQRLTFGRGDFLVRPILRIDDEGLMVGDAIKPGQTVQLHVRDAETAREDLNALLTERREALAGRARGALLFTCNGRGERLFGSPGHDSDALRGALGDLAIGGFFCAGELGPIGARHFLHGFTSSVGIFSALPAGAEMEA